MSIGVGRWRGWTELSVGLSHVCALKTGGELYCWGSNYSGELGDGTLDDSVSPVRVGTDADFQHVGAGGNETQSRRQAVLLGRWLRRQARRQ